MSDTTTIEIKDEQKRVMNGLKYGENEPYKDVLQRLIEDYSGSSEVLNEDRVRQVAREEIRDVVVREALE